MSQAIEASKVQTFPVLNITVYGPFARTAPCMSITWRRKSDSLFMAGLYLGCKQITLLSTTAAYPLDRGINFTYWSRENCCVRELANLHHWNVGRQCWFWTRWTNSQRRRSILCVGQWRSTVLHAVLFFVAIVPRRSSRQCGHVVSTYGSILHREKMWASISPVCMLLSSYKCFSNVVYCECCSDSYVGLTVCGHWQVVDVLTFVAKKENLVLPPELAGRIAHHSSRNLRRSILCLEACKIKQ